MTTTAPVASPTRRLATGLAVLGLLAATLSRGAGPLLVGAVVLVLVGGAFSSARVSAAAGAAAGLGALLAALAGGAALLPATAGEWTRVAGVLVLWALLPLAARAAANGRRARLFLLVPVFGLALSDVTIALRRRLGPVNRTSRYVPTQDGTRIAIDLYLPRGAASGSLDAVLTQTRYHRSPVFVWPLSLLLDDVQDEIIRVGRRGYAWVVADARGSGASFGFRDREWPEAEVLDGRALPDWIVAQPWSTGRVGLDGSSYSATAAELMLRNRHPAVRAAVLRYSLIDPYDDIAFPGGIPHEWFTTAWGRTNVRLDTGAPAGPAWLARIMGIRPVDGDSGRRLLAEALLDHRRSYDLERFARSVTFRDDTSSAGWTIDAPAPFRWADDIWRSGVPILSWSGWFDGGYTRATTTRFVAGDSSARLLLGPWEHGGVENISPHRRGRATFDLIGEMLAFFDWHLKGVRNEASAAPNVRYFTIGEERWHGAPTWPPPGSTAATLYFGPDGTLLDAAPPAAGTTRYLVDTTATSGPRSRWHSILNQAGVPIGYPDRATEDRKLLTFTTPPLDRDRTVAGHPVVHLRLSSTAPDGQFYAYLEEVAPDGRVTYVTEGMLRGVHRHVAPRDSAPYPGLGPFHSFRRADASPLVPGEIAELAFDLQPVAYRFARGSRIRLALAGADRDFAPLLSRDSPTWTLEYGGGAGSRLALPILTSLEAESGAK